MVAIMAIGPAARPNRERLLVALGAIFFTIRAGWITAQWWQADRALTTRLAILNEVPRGSRLGFLSVEADCRTGWTLTPDRKLGAYAIVRRDSFTNTLFQIPGSDLMIIRRPSDRATWFDSSQDIPTGCPEAAVDMRALRDRMSRMEKDGFTGLWIAGIGQHAVPSLPGYSVAYSRGMDTLLLKTGPGA